jgi:hypothetical protein
MLANGSLKDLGYFEVLHKISTGESISVIASRYRHRGWPVGSVVDGTNAIWRVNTEVYSNLRDRDNPDQIFPDDFLVIPRSRQGYERCIHRLMKISRELAADDSATRSLEEIQQQADKFGAKVDLASDVLTLFATVTLKSVKLVKLAGAAHEASKIALKEAVKEQDKLAIEITKDFAKFVSGQLASAVGGAGGNETVKTGAETANKAAWKVGEAKETIKLVTKGELEGTAKVLSKAARGSAALLRVADILVDFISPSWLARKLTGFDKTMEESKKYAEQAKATQLKVLNERISAKQAEMELVWPSKKN